MMLLDMLQRDLALAPVMPGVKSSANMSNLQIGDTLRRFSFFDEACW
jgi:hypothetical protein